MNETIANRWMEECRSSLVGVIDFLVYLRKYVLNTIEWLMIDCVLFFSLIPPDSEVLPKQLSDMNETNQESQLVDAEYAITMSTGSSFMKIFQFLERFTSRILMMRDED